jgi:hypothetical protein
MMGPSARVTFQPQVHARRTSKWTVGFPVESRTGLDRTKGIGMFYSAVDPMDLRSLRVIEYALGHDRVTPEEPVNAITLDASGQVGVCPTDEQVLDYALWCEKQMWIAEREVRWDKDIEEVERRDRQWWLTDKPVRGLALDLVMLASQRDAALRPCTCQTQHPDDPTPCPACEEIDEEDIPAYLSDPTVEIIAGKCPICDEPIDFCLGHGDLNGVDDEIIQDAKDSIVCQAQMWENLSVNVRESVIRGVLQEVEEENDIEAAEKEERIEDKLDGLDERFDDIQDVLDEWIDLLKTGDPEGAEQVETISTHLTKIQHDLNVLLNG